MAVKEKETFIDPLTTAVPKKEEEVKEPTVSVFLPELEDPGTEGIKIDQYEHVTIGNEKGDKVWYVKRGEHVDVPVSVFMVLKERYPKL